jgi:hypothetical protein
MRCLCVIPFMLLSAPAFAQQGLPAQVYACADIADANQRHACFDALVPELKKAGGASAVVTTPAPQSALTAPVLSASEARAAANAKKETSPDKAEFKVTAIGSGPDGKYRFTMENGQIWRQTDTVKLRNLGDGPWTAEIRKASLGGFFLSIGNSPALRVSRVN